MFNLEQAVADWRRQLISAKIQTPVTLDELESHLREEIEQQMKSGRDAEQAYKNAVQHLGEINALKTEFKQAGRAVDKRWFRSLGPVTAAFVTGCLVTMHFSSLFAARQTSQKVLASREMENLITSINHYNDNHVRQPAPAKRQADPVSP